MKSIDTYESPTMSEIALFTEQLFAQSQMFGEMNTAGASLTITPDDEILDF